MARGIQQKAQGTEVGPCSSAGMPCTPQSTWLTMLHFGKTPSPAVDHSFVAPAPIYCIYSIHTLSTCTEPIHTRIEMLAPTPTCRFKMETLMESEILTV